MDYDPEQSDIYSLGCFLFVMLTKLTVNDYALKLILKREIWAKLGISFSDNLKDLLT
jgi:hypothetical protein